MSAHYADKSPVVLLKRKHSRKNALLIAGGIAGVFLFNNALAQQPLSYHSCGNVRALVDALINPALSEEQKKLL